MRKPNVGKSPDLGQRIRKRRKYVGLTQAALASELGISFQQMQKYEKGINAISVARLQRICEVLSLPTNYFLSEEPPMIGRAASGSDSADEDAALASFLVTAEGRRLAKAFSSIGDQRLRTHILDFVAAIAADAEVEPAGDNEHS